MQRYLVYCGVLILGSPCVLAGTATATLNVTATVISACSVSVPTNVAFGNYNPASGSPTNTTGTLNVTCTSSTPYQIAMDAGANASTANNTTTKRMRAAGSHYFPYSLYLDSGHTTIWGDGNNSSSLYPTNCTYCQRDRCCTKLQHLRANHGQSIRSPRLVLRYSHRDSHL